MHTTSAPTAASNTNPAHVSIRAPLRAMIGRSAWAAVLRSGLPLAAAGLLAGCVSAPSQPLPMPTRAQTTPSQRPGAAVRPPAATFQTMPPQRAPSQADAFLAALRPYCGQAFAGRVVADIPSPAPAGAAPPAKPAEDPFAGKALVMHVRECAADVVRIPFHVGTDRSRTWVLTRTANGLRLKHDHRHEDGTSDKVTMYGGDTAAAGTAQRQAFPVDAESIANFNANGLTASVENTWAMEMQPGRRFLYELSRPNGRLFRVEFDLRRPVPAPPAPWGH